jgi:cytochrome c-type biogenesis protein CcmH
MTIVLLALAAILAAAAVWFLVRPLAHGTHVESREQYYQLLAVRDRLLAQLNELDLDERDRSMNTDTAADERARLEAELAQVLKKLDAIAPETGQAQEGRPRSKQVWRWTVVALALIVPLVAAGFYLVNVSVSLTQREQVAAVSPGGMPDPMQMVARLEKRLQENPDDLAGWLRLGRSYGVLGRLEDAKLAYDHAYRLLPKNFQAESPEELWFLGIAAYDRGEMPRALDLWGKLLATLPPESDAAQQLRHAMEQAKKQGSKKK